MCEKAFRKHRDRESQCACIDEHAVRVPRAACGGCLDDDAVIPAADKRAAAVVSQDVLAVPGAWAFDADDLPAQRKQAEGAQRDLVLPFLPPSGKSRSGLVKS